MHPVSTQNHVHLRIKTHLHRKLAHVTFRRRRYTQRTRGDPKHSDTSGHHMKQQPVTANEFSQQHGAFARLINMNGQCILVIIARYNKCSVDTMAVQSTVQRATQT